jgi:hypothetical protein
MLISLPLLVVASLNAPQQQAPPVYLPPRRPQTVVRDSSPPDTSRNHEAGRRRAVTAQLLATAFKDQATRDLFERARRARLEQDSAIKSYDAMSRERLSVNLGIGSRGREHLFYRRESAARVRWQHDVGAVVEITGSRAGIPMAPKSDELGESLGNLGSVSPIPYYPGMESLMIGDEASTHAEANDKEIVNPLTVGAEAYYTYAIADSVSFKLPNKDVIRLREIEVRPREPRWNLAVGSFWFDDNGRLVKSAYRLSVPLDVWEMVEEEADSSDEVPGIVKGLLSPMRLQITGIAIEYSLMQGRFWLPSMRAMTGDAQIMFARIPVRIDQRFEYRSVNGPDLLPPMDTTRLPRVLTEEEARVRRENDRKADSTRRAFLESLPEGARAAARDSIRRVRDSVRGIDHSRSDSGPSRDVMLKAVADSIDRGLSPVGAQLIARNGAPCDSSGMSTRYLRRFDARMPVAVRVPCNINTLLHSPDLPPSIYDSGDELFSTKDRDEMLNEALSLGAQAPFSLGAGLRPKPTYSFGLPMTRFNRVEGFSTGIAVDQQLGAGLSVGGSFRFGLADKVPNVEIDASRSNLRKTISVAGYHRLVSANDWGNPLSFGSSFSALMFGKDEGFYYRASGGEVAWTRGVESRFEWKVFAEDQNAAPVNTQTSLVHRSSADTFPANIAAAPGVYIGSAMHIVHNHGLDPRGFRTFTDIHLETAASDSFYARGSANLDLSMGTPLGTMVGLTLSGGSSLGFLPPQRRWYLGGTQTVRGQDADTTYGGNIYALTRIELARDNRTHRSSIFADAGWAGRRDRLALDDRLLTGVGYGESMFDGILRVDLSRGLQPKRQWRFDVYLEARF